MSVNMDMSDHDTDYSDFEYQHNEVQLAVDGGVDNSPNVGAKMDIEPLEGIGGLDNNEVAELVYLETQVSVEWEDESTDQDVASSAEIRGVVGANLPASDGILPADQTQEDGTVYDDSNDAVTTAASYSLTEDRIFQHFKSRGSPPFDDETNGPGGNAEHQLFYAEKPFRELVGRGPVLDSSDDMGVNMRYIVGDAVINSAAVVDCTFVWDIAETDDAGRAFSVPR